MPAPHCYAPATDPLPRIPRRPLGMDPVEAIGEPCQRSRSEVVAECHRQLARAAELLDRAGGLEQAVIRWRRNGAGEGSDRPQVPAPLPAAPHPLW